MGRMLDVTTVAARLDVSAQQVRGLIEEGRLFGIDVGLGKQYRRFKVPEEALEAFIKAQGNGVIGRMKVR